MLKQLKQLFYKNVIWFDCFTTLSFAKEKRIIENEEFQKVEIKLCEMQIIRTFVDRSDVFFNIHFISWEHLNTYNQLFFPLNDVVNFNEKVISNKIFKIIVFIDNILKKHIAIACIWNLFLTLNKNVIKKSKYVDQNSYRENESEDVCFVKNIIQKFNSCVLKRG